MRLCKQKLYKSLKHVYISDFIVIGVTVWMRGCVQQQRRSRTVGTQTLQTALRKLRALDVILTVGRGVKPEDKGTAAGEEVLVESMQCLLALVQVCCCRLNIVFATRN